MHWRWGEEATHPGLKARLLAGLKGGAQFNEGKPIVDPENSDQSIELAVTSADEGIVEWQVNRNPSTLVFEDLFTKTNRDTHPADLEKGARLALWVSITAFRDEQRQAKNWSGTLFTHGLFFAHSPDPLDLRFSRFSPLTGPLPADAKLPKEWHRLAPTLG
jgi:hypothetical protein